MTVTVATRPVASDEGEGAAERHPQALPADDHVHSEFSYDTGPDASMLEACRQAVDVGLPSIAFTEHLEIVHAGPGDAFASMPATVGYGRRLRPLDHEGYAAAVDECRAKFPTLRILTGVEAGQPHLFAGTLASVLAGGDFQRVLGSCHALVYDGELVDADELFDRMSVADAVRYYFAEVLAVVEGSSAFQVLAHVDFIGRYLPPSATPYRDSDYEDEYRTIFGALAASGRALELNTKSGTVSVAQLKWWYEAGGAAVSFGSDAHVPWAVGRGFATAAAMAEAAGFRPGRHPYDWWRR
jgi:histidinol-phosphatase (PHP family)